MPVAEILPLPMAKIQRALIPVSDKAGYRYLKVPNWGSNWFFYPDGTAGVKERPSRDGHGTAILVTGATLECQSDPCGFHASIKAANSFVLRNRDFHKCQDDPK